MSGNQIIFMDLDTRKKWGLIVKAVVIMLILLIPRTIIDISGYDTVPINPVVGAFITGAIFTIAIIFSGTFTDFKESEKVGGDLAASLGPCPRSPPDPEPVLPGQLLEPSGDQPGHG